MDKKTTKEFINLTKRLMACDIDGSIGNKEPYNIELIPILINEGLYDEGAIIFQTSGGKIWLLRKQRQEFLTLRGREIFHDTRVARLRRWIFQIITHAIAMAISAVITAFVIKLAK